MFPNFKSLADREEKRLSLLEKTERRKRQSAQKREMYESTQWASDANKSIDLSEKRTVSSDTQTSTPISTQASSVEEEIGTSKKASDLNDNLQKVQISGNIPEVVEQEVKAEVEQEAKPDISDEAKAREEYLKYAEDVKKSHKQAWKMIRAMYANNPKLAARKLHPFLKLKSRYADLYLGEGGDLFLVSTDQPTKAPMGAIDWIETKELVDVYQALDVEEKSPTDAEQAEARKKIPGLLKDAVWIRAKLHPWLKDGTRATHLFIGPKASILNVADDSEAVESDIDWHMTYRAILVARQLSTKERLARDIYAAQDRIRAQKRTDADEVRDARDRAKERVLEDPDAKSVSTSIAETSTTADGKDWESMLTTLLTDARDEIVLNHLSKSIHPIDNDDSVRSDAYIWFRTSGDLAVFSSTTNYRLKSILRELDWHETLLNTIKTLEDNGIAIPDKAIYKNRGVFKRSENPSNPDIELRSKETGLDSALERSEGILDFNRILSMSEEDGQTVLTRYFKRLLSTKTPILFKLHPMVETDNGIVYDQIHYISDPTTKRIVNLANSGDDSSLKGKQFSDTIESIRYLDTLILLINGIGDYEKAAREEMDMVSDATIDFKDASAREEAKQTARELIEEVQRHTGFVREAMSGIIQGIVQPDEWDDTMKTPLDKKLETIEKEIAHAEKMLKEAKDLLQKAIRLHDPRMDASVSRLQAARSAVKSWQSLYNTKRKTLIAFYPRAKPKQTRGKGVVGRGLRGAGYAHIPRKAKYYNLNDIQGTGLASAYIYRKLGSKYIRIPDLDRRELNIVYPSRKKLGPKRDISDAMQRMLKSLVYDTKIDQAMYDSLTHDDKRLFKEILSATHIQHAFRDELQDPLESLKAEYDKLKGEIELGNDNPSIMGQFKTILVDMYRSHLISDTEFKQMIVHI